MSAVVNMREIGADVGRGLGAGTEEMVLGALIMAPFTATLVVLLGWMVPLPAVVAMLLFVVLTVPAALWNAGLRARGGAA